MPRTVALRCDGGPDVGVGHVVRCLAIAEELVGRGAHAVLLGSLDGVDWVRRAFDELGVPVRPAAPDPHGLLRQVREAGATGVVLDGYGLSPQIGSTLMGAGLGVLAIVDGPWGADQVADVYVDQNLGAAPLPEHPGARQLLGLEHALLRNAVLHHRRNPQTVADTGDADGRARPVRVLTVFGGTDAMGASPLLTPLVLATGRPVQVVAIAARADVRQVLEGLRPAPGQQMEVRTPDANLPALAATCDLAVTAAGTSVWEFLCQGLPCAVVQVVDNQAVGYERVIGEGLAVGLGRLADIADDEEARTRALGRLDGILGDAARRESLTRRGMRLVDGLGRARVVDALMQHMQ
ncbi:spore coat protein [Intrasporangium oryzae NRRL B-24470]|uniref:Spore coat protein n=1 Tax=Intrasporangium oryzae NRRL B-24470 TaxID=1386089 RepID=W9G8I7_9MICO|nr:hypothetical protein [Intrasporangium oryzae]EWT01138.1 spore coat protein [Intrasporangium oryzae NRRL B-24470]